MDVVLNYLDDHWLDSVYTTLFPSSLANIGVDASTTITDSPTLSLFPRDSIIRQLVSLFFLAWSSSFLLYMGVSILSYYYLFDRRLEHHPRFLKNQIKMEIDMSLRSQPIIAALIVPWFVAEIRGKTLMYDNFSDYGAGWFQGTMAVFLLFTDFCIYWIHRWLHIPAIYKRLHKPHHKWVVPTPFASLAFHPLDGYAQSVPYHLVVFILPVHKWIYLGLFVIINLWTIVIHDGDMISGHLLEKYINSPAHHTLHHMYFTCNYGQYFTWADSWGGSYRPPRPDLDPIHDAIKNMERKRKLAEKDQQRIEASAASASATADERVTVVLDGADSDSGYEGSEAEGEEVAKWAGKKQGGDGEVRRRR
ncbi:C-5 sterol desaturase [Filobasidium floriforme]|uniref:C-5 sterol desaturase n=1 Tax=Filobasidium floriforme TaxID=5210 RepID=UPI001E8DEC0F|nr:C-5 sterol desaturase [Filobasidium floriforme]KAH8083646.1 C-5 sterol desaturase [Filobasidium floriforme]